MWGILLVRIAISHSLPVAVLAELGDDVIGSLVADPVCMQKTRMLRSRRNFTVHSIRENSYASSKVFNNKKNEVDSNLELPY